MKHIFLSSLVLAALTLCGQAQASIVISDNYIGASRTNSPTDVMNNDMHFDVDHLKVDFSGNLMSVTVYTNFKEPYGTYKYGDLFISTTGWNPAGTAASKYKEDNFLTTGTNWNYVFDTSAGALYGGDFTTILSNNSGVAVYRPNQVVLRGTGGTDLYDSPVLIGTDTIDGHVWNTITYTFDYTLLALDLTREIALRWAENCGNDIIEGILTAPELPPTSQVPTPGTLALLGAALLAALGTRRFTAKP